MPNLELTGSALFAKVRLTEGLAPIELRRMNMAKIAELTDPAVWEEWVSTRPPVVQDLCRRYPPDRLYLLTPPGQRVTLVSYNENGTVNVYVSAQWNCLVFEREVFGVDPNDLEECDLPNEN